MLLRLMMRSNIQDNPINHLFSLLLQIYLRICLYYNSNYNIVIILTQQIRVSILHSKPRWQKWDCLYLASSFPDFFFSCSSPKGQAQKEWRNSHTSWQIFLSFPFCLTQIILRESCSWGFSGRDETRAGVSRPESDVCIFLLLFLSFKYIFIMKKASLTSGDN